MEGYKNKIIALVLSVFFISASLTVSTYAWKDPATLTPSCDVNRNILAENGDVVTTDKWNQMVCYIKILWSKLEDWPYHITYFIGTGVNNSNGNPLVTEINLPATIEYAGGLHFKDPAMGYNTPHAWKGGVAWKKETNTMVLSANGGIRIATTEDDTIQPWQSWLVGWEKISLTDTTPFDVSCQYRFITSHGTLTTRRYYAGAVTDAFLTMVEDANWADEFYTPDRIIIPFNAKSNPWYQDATGWNYGAPHGAFITFMEKLCLPSYNPNNY